MSATPPADPLPDRSSPAADHGAVVDALAPLLGLRVEPAWRDAVAFNLATVAKAAELVLAFPLDDELEPAPVFRA